MKTTLIFLLTILVLQTACKNSGDKSKSDVDTTLGQPKTSADTLLDDVLRGHDLVMGKMGRLSALEKQVQGVLDSIGKLPAKTRVKLAPYREKMEKTLEDLKSAKSGMDKWMDEFNFDSAKDNVEARIRYLSDEKLKVSVVKENILRGLEKADSLIKAKF